MKHLIAALLCLVVIASGFIPLVHAQELTFTSGETLSHTLSVCLDKKDALEILEAHKKHGREKANELWMAKDRCGNVPVVGGVVGKVVKSAKVGDVTSSVVEILAGSEVIGYFLTTAPVNKPQRNT